MRALVHGYDGRPYVVVGDTVFFSNAADHRVYRQQGATAPVAFSTTVNRRYADGCYDEGRRRLLYVREKSATESGLVENAIVAISIDDPKTEQVIVPSPTGNPCVEFYAAPRLSPDGQLLAWIFWKHPAMPWTESTLCFGKIRADGMVTDVQTVAGGPGVSILQPEWSPQGTLHYLSNETNWWNIYRWDGQRSRAVTQIDAEIGAPLWHLGASYYAFSPAGGIAFTLNELGVWSLAVVGADGCIRRIETPFQDCGFVSVLGNEIVCVAGAPDRPKAVVAIDMANGAVREIRASTTIPAELLPYVSVPVVKRFGSAAGFYYAPRNSDFQPAPNEIPPLIVNCHGGPTAAASSAISLAVQFWTSRGFAYFDLNYRGSNGYGRDYMNQIKESWGVVDVEDAVSAAQGLADAGLADRRRMIIRGGSAGGYTALAALAFHDTFQAGGSYYGIGNLEMLLDTHKFEMHYLDWLVGEYPAQKDLYIERSPVHAAARMTAPVIFLQGEDDTVVLPKQSAEMSEALRSRGILFAYLLFAGEGHGFRKASTIVRALEAELNFYTTALLHGRLRY